MGTPMASAYCCRTAVTRPTPAALAFARSTLPVRRVASNGTVPSGFAALLKAAAQNQPKRSTAQPQVASKAPEIYHAAMLPAGVVSKAWDVARHTTDTFSSVASPISKDELQAGDALNLTTGRDPEGDGHVRLFESWANPEHTKMYVYEETPPRSVHHVINWDPKYQPMRRNNVVDG